MPLCFLASGSVRASSAPQSARCAEEVQTFWPLIRQPPSTLVALVRQRRPDPTRRRVRRTAGTNRSRRAASAPANCARAARRNRRPAPWAGSIRAMPSDGRTRYGPLVEFLVDDQLLGRRRRPAPTAAGRCGATRPAVGQRGALRPGPELARTPGSAGPGCRCATRRRRRGLRRSAARKSGSTSVSSMVKSAAGPVRVAQRARPIRRRPDRGGQADGTLPVQVQVVLPGVADRHRTWSARRPPVPAAGRSP